MSLHDLLNDLSQRDILWRQEVGGGVVVAVELADVSGENFSSPGSHGDVVLDALQPPPGGVTTVVARVVAAAQEVGEEPVTNTRRKRHDIGSARIQGLIGQPYFFQPCLRIRNL